MRTTPSAATRFSWLLLLTLAGGLPAQRGAGPLESRQERGQAELALARDTKRAQPCFQAAAWSFDYDAARAKSTKSGKPVFLYLVRSSVATPRSKAIEEKVFLDPDFLAFAKDVELCCHIVSDVVGDPRPGLMQELRGKLYPMIAMVDGQGNRLAICRPDPSPAAFRSILAAVRACDELGRKVAAGDKSQAIPWLLSRIELEQLPMEKAKEEVAALGELPKADRDRLEIVLLNLDVETTLEGSLQLPDAAKAGRRFDAVRKTGLRPTGRALLDFLALILEAKWQDHDAAGYADVFAEYKKLLGDTPAVRRVLVGMEQRLKRLQESATPAANGTPAPGTEPGKGK